MKIRNITLDDVEQLIPLFSRFYEITLKDYNIPIDHGSVVKTIVQYISNPDCVNLALEIEGKIVGIIAGVLAPFPLNEKVNLFIESVWYVKKEHRRHSIRLLEAIERMCKAKGITRIMVGNTEMGDCEKFQRFYFRKGYKLFEQHFIKEL